MKQLTFLLLVLTLGCVGCVVEAGSPYIDDGGEVEPIETSDYVASQSETVIVADEGFSAEEMTDLRAAANAWFEKLPCLTVEITQGPHPNIRRIQDEYPRAESGNLVLGRVAHDSPKYMMIYVSAIAMHGRDDLYRVALHEFGHFFNGRGHHEDRGIMGKRTATLGPVIADTDIQHVCSQNPTIECCPQIMETDPDTLP